MQELIRQLLGYLRGMWHRRWIGLACAWVVALVAVIVVFRIPERYEASARVYVDTQTLLKPLLAGLAIQPDLDQQVVLMSRTLISRPNVEKLVRMADLDLRVKTSAERDRLIDSVMQSIRLSGGLGTNLYILSYQDPDPAGAKRVVQSLLSIFVDSSLGDKRQNTQSAVKFVDDEIKHYEENLTAAETRLKDFKLKYLAVMGGQGSDYFGRLGTVHLALDDAKLELNAAEQTRDAYKRELDGEAPTLMTDTPANQESSEALPEIDSRISALKRNLDDLLRKYTEQHPDVVGTRRLIKELEQQRHVALAARLKAPRRGAGPAELETNPIFQQIRVSLADADAAVASARAKVASYESELDQLQLHAKRSAEIEAEFSQLNRDYDVQKKTYENLLSRREGATIGEEVQDTGGPQFRVIDPPWVSDQPVAPNRTALLGLAGVLSILGGLLGALAASEVMPIFHDPQTLRELTKRPILGTVSMVVSDVMVRARRRNSFLFAGGISGLLAVFPGVIIATHLLARFH